MTTFLFETAAPKPLAEQLRPQRLEDVIGQEHILDPGNPLGSMIASGSLASTILVGPPGVGKTTTARLLAKKAGLEFEQISAVMVGIAELRKVVDAAREKRRASGRGTVLFVDEIHRWNKSQQDALLPYVEDGTVTLIGATTENVSFELNGALLSRCRVVELRRFDETGLGRLAERAEAHVGRKLPVTSEARAVLLAMADGDGRYLLNMCEDLFRLKPKAPLDPDSLQEAVQRRATSHDKAGDAHHQLLSAFQKSIRGSDVQAALFWLARMLRAGESPKAIFRRLAVMAVEEIGLADPMAVQAADACARNFERIGEPEGLPQLAQCAAYLATAVKSNAVYKAFYAAMDLAEATGSIPPPKHIINAPTDLMKEQGYKDGYQYDHDWPDAFSGQEFFPAGLDGPNRPELYKPNERGHEREILKRMQWWDARREKIRGGR